MSVKVHPLKHQWLLGWKQDSTGSLSWCVAAFTVQQMKDFLVCKIMSQGLRPFCYTVVMVLMTQLALSTQSFFFMKVCMCTVGMFWFIATSITSLSSDELPVSVIQFVRQHGFKVFGSFSCHQNLLDDSLFILLD